MAVMNGFRKELLDKILGLNGHLLIQPLESPLTEWQQVTERVAAMALTLSLLATVYPSWRAARLDPVETLRYE
jgi:ABC-type lipoprotein release transport system permease subunit